MMAWRRKRNCFPDQSCLCQNPSELSNIKKVYVDLPNFTNYRDSVVEHLQMMPEVEILEIGGSFNVSRHAREKNLKMSFQNLLRGKVSPSL
jgi:hypothetical protein